MASFVRMILQAEENKGVDLTVYPCNGLRALDGEGPLRGEGRGLFSTLASRETKMRFAAEAAGQIEWVAGASLSGGLQAQ